MDKRFIYYIFSILLCFPFSFSSQAQNNTRKTIKKVFLKKSFQKKQSALNKKIKKIIGSSRKTNLRIVGGTFANASDYSSFVGLLEYNSQTRQIRVPCGGNLIAKEWVITAAHCVSQRLNYVAFGKNNFIELSPSELIPIEKIIVHPQYFNGGLNYDIALLKIRNSFDANISYVSTSSITELLIRSGMPVTAVGYGLTDEKATGRDYRLRNVTIPLVSRQQCSNAFSVNIPSTMVCAGGEPAGGKDSCFGDSGGPLFYKFNNILIQVGIVSWGDGCGRAGTPGVYTNIANFRDWISTQIRNN